MSKNAAHNVLISGRWRPATAAETFQSTNPATGELLPDIYPKSEWVDLDAALEAAVTAFNELQLLPRSLLAAFLSNYADAIEQRAEEIVAAAAAETALPAEPRLRSIELPRTTNQLRKAASVCLKSDWRMPTIDVENNLRSLLEPLGPVLTIGPNNFPLAFNAISGGDFAAAIAAGCPVIAKAHHLHPTTSRLLAETAQGVASDLPAGTIQMLYAMDNKDGLRMAKDERLGALAFTGSRPAGLKLKAAADEVGTPAYVELSSINPVVILPGALSQRLEEIVQETVTSALMGGGQFCTNPGLILTVAGASSEQFAESLVQHYADTAPSTLLSQQGLESLENSISTLQNAGATLAVGGRRAEGAGFRYHNTLLRVSGSEFLKSSSALQTEAFGNCTLLVACHDISEMLSTLESLEPSLTGCIYSAEDGSEDDVYERLATVMTPRVGRIINDKMPTGVAVSPAMNHGGPFPATGHPHFTAVGLPAACRRFTRLVCFDNVRPSRLPEFIRDAEDKGQP